MQQLLNSSLKCFRGTFKIQGRELLAQILRDAM